MGPGWMLAVAEMHPAAPRLKPSISRTSEEGKMARSGKAAIRRLVPSQSPDESFRPAMVSGIGLAKPLDQRRRDGRGRHLREVVEIELQAGIADALDDLGEIGKEPARPLVLVVEGRQHQNAAGACLNSVAGHRHRIGNGAGAGSRHEAMGGDACFNQVIDEAVAFGGGERIALAGGAEDGETTSALIQQPAADAHEPRRIGFEVGGERASAPAPARRKRLSGTAAHRSGSSDLSAARQGFTLPFARLKLG